MSTKTQAFTFPSDAAEDFILGIIDGYSPAISAAGAGFPTADALALLRSPEFQAGLLRLNVAALAAMNEQPPVVTPATVAPAMAPAGNVIRFPGR
jgi:hypothetical protein